MVKLIQRLQEKSFTYPGEGSIYYRIAKFPEYEALQDRSERHSDGRARRQRPLRKKRARAGFCSVESAETGRALLGRQRSDPGAQAGTLSVPRWHEVISRRHWTFTLVESTWHFRNHENEIAQSGARRASLSRVLAARRALLVEGENDVEVAGEFFSRCAICLPKVTSLRLCVCSGQCSLPPSSSILRSMSAAGGQLVERLRNFADRMKRGKFPLGNKKGMAARIAKAAEEFDAGLSDDLNIGAGAGGNVRPGAEANIAVDKGEFRRVMSRGAGVSGYFRQSIRGVGRQ